MTLGLNLLKLCLREIIQANAKYESSYTLFLVVMIKNFQ